MLHSMQVREECAFVSQIEKGRGISGSGSSHNGGRTEGRAGRYDKIETSGTGPCPCFHCVLSLKRSDRGLDHLPNEHPRRSTGGGPAGRVRGIRNGQEFPHERGSSHRIHQGRFSAHPQPQGYALVEYETFEDAQNAIKNLEGSTILGQQIHADWAFVKS